MSLAQDSASTFFEQKVRPLLANHCYRCHGPEKQQGKLRLDSLDAMKKGGELGAVLVPGKPDDSRLIQAVRYKDELKMPPKGKLPEADIAILVTWVKTGANWPAAQPVKVVDAPGFTAEQRNYWAFKLPVAFKPPAVHDVSWSLNPIDQFILAKLEAKALRPAPPADKRTLIRRLSFDLTGLPPTPEEVEAFLADTTPLAIERLIDRLLESPGYGERWGRRWLDVARFADSNGMDENLSHGNAWRYRDHVIASFNRDQPYRDFVREQIAGDLLPPTGDLKIDSARIIATGFLSLGPKMLAEDDPVKMQMDIVDEQIDAVGQAFLGLTLGCARCHDHKFDPIPTTDYYALAGIFKSTKTMDNFSVVARWHERPLTTPDTAAKLAQLEQQIADKKAEIARQAGKPEEVKRLQKELAQLEKSRSALPQAMAVSEGKTENVRVHIRGSHLTLGAEVPRRFPRILAGETQSPLNASQSGRRELAEWLTRDDHPLTARVMVNRIWLGHFGEGLVRTPDNFGSLGDRPVHPELLDWLAVEFVKSGWSIKKLHRLILTSNTYRMSTAFDEKAALLDPDNRLHWRFKRQRLEAEALRDAILSASGRLDRTMTGSLLTVPNRAYVTSTVNRSYEGYDHPRRSVYLPVVRSDLFDLFQAFDFADPSTLMGKRATTTVAPQALFMMNGRLMQEETRRLAEQLLKLTHLNDAGRLKLVYTRVYGRSPSERESAQAVEFLRRYQAALEVKKSPDARLGAWQGLCRVLLSSNEFVYVE
jgi:hypothetical protein